MPFELVTSVPGASVEWPPSSKLRRSSFFRPVHYLGIAGLFFCCALGGLTAQSAALAFVFLVFGACGVLAYILNKQMGLHVQNGGDKLYGMEFNRSLIEGVDVAERPRGAP